MRVDKSVILVNALVGITLLSATILSSTITSATAENTDIIDQVNVTVPVSCSMEATGMDSHITQLHNNEYNSNVGTTNAKAYCNDVNGFAIYAIGYTDDTDGKNVLTDSNLASTNDITTGVTTSGDYSKWAMKLTTPTSPTPTYPLSIQNNFDSFHTVPDDYTMVAKRTSATDAGSSAIGSTFTTTYQIYIGPTQSAGTYEGQVKYVLVHPHDAETPLSPVPCVAGKICYQPNTRTVTGQMGQQSASDGNSVTLYASNFSRAGYGFVGWNDKYDYTGTFYGPNQTITVPNGTTANGLSLYAVWVPSVGSMQSNATTACNGLTQDPNDGTAGLSSVTALTDERDNNTYAIAKLADGKCWMIENLRLDNTPELTASNTHNPSLPLTNIYDSSTSSNHLSPTSSVAYDATTAPEGWCTAAYDACDNQSRLRTDNTILYTNNTASNYSAFVNVYSYGNYYNWYSATAGHGVYGKSNSNTAGDICPAGWHLPTGNTTGEYYALNTAINNGATDSTASNKLRSYPNSFVYSGIVNGSSVSNRNSYGSYYSSSASSNGSAYYLFLSGNVLPGTGYYSNFDGETVRCVSGV